MKLILYIKYFLHNYGLSKENKNVNDDNKLIFIHNPKVAGNSLIKILNITLKEGESTSHQTPTFLVKKSKWEKYFSVVAVRHPIDRLISSYNYHTKASYAGHFLRKYPDLHEFSFERYFEVFSKESYAIIPQVNYTKHLMSRKPVDYIIKYEALQESVFGLCNVLNIPKHDLPHLNKSPKKEINYFEDNAFKNRVLAYYKEDFNYFKYDPNI